MALGRAARHRLYDPSLLILIFGISQTLSYAQFQVVSVQPEARRSTTSVDTVITVEFNKPVDRTTVVALRSFWAFGRWSGTVTGTFSYSELDHAVTLTPDFPFSAGENVMVILSHDLRATDGTNLRPQGYSFQFWTKSSIAGLNFVEIQRLSTRTDPNASSQAYGGFVSDLNGDRFLDLTIVNEITADLRVFLNHADGTGTFADFIQPTFPSADRASPSEPTDFNRDGNVDICIANIGDNSVSILLGVGDGTFAAQQKVVVGLAPRGIAVMDVDGDGDMDIINTNSSSDNMSILLNDGAGVFGAPTFFEGGGSGEWALAAADMNQDGLLDLVIGAHDSEQVLVNTNNGDGTFDLVSTQSAGGKVWMLVCGDLNGDGTEDVSVVNGFSNNAGILLGDGGGNLSTPQLYTPAAFVLATDLGDIDGDGDLDWVTSSFSGEWALYLNDGTGQFEIVERFPAPSAGSCCLMFDANNDGDLDLALIDELADLVLIMDNQAPECNLAEDQVATLNSATKGHHEIVRDPPSPERMLQQRVVEPARLWVQGAFTSVQVNVDESGNNTVGDAANEPSMAIDPTNSNNVVIGWRQFDTTSSDFRQAGVAYSHDSGNSWTNPGVLDPGIWRTDPVLGADTDGNFYYFSECSAVSVSVFKSTDGGVSWLAPVDAWGGDKHWFTIDRTSGIGRNYLYNQWGAQFSCCGASTFSRSTDRAGSFEVPVELPDPLMKWGTMDVGSDGTLYVTGATLTLDTHVVATSSNAQAGTSAPSFDHVGTVELGGVTTFGGLPNPNGLLGHVWIATDHSSGVTAANVYILASVVPPGPDPMDVMLIRSVDHAETWSAPIRVNDDLGCAWQWFGTMSIAPNGRIDATWL